MRYRIAANVFKVVGLRSCSGLNLAVRLNDPEVSLTFKDFDKPRFTVIDEVANPGDMG